MIFIPIHADRNNMIFTAYSGSCTIIKYYIISFKIRLPALIENVLTHILYVVNFVVTT